MTMSTQRGKAPADNHPARSVADQVGRLARAAKAWRAAMTDPHRHPRGAAHMLLLPLDGQGPMRSTELSECMHIDPSTISRHVSLLLTEGLVERLPDPKDGRASLLALTAAGRQQVADMHRSRDEMVSNLLADWDQADAETLGRLLARFNDRFEAALPTAAKTLEAS
jgi:DNA-binding MarR family transcriptional regulator